MRLTASFDIYLVDSFAKCLQIYPLGVSVPNDKILLKPEVSHNKVKIEVVSFDIARGALNSLINVCCKQLRLLFAGLTRSSLSSWILAVLTADAESS